MTTLAERYQLHHFIDTFALGHYARVLNAYDLSEGNEVAFKVLRTEHLTGDLSWEYQAFGNEVSLLIALAESPHVIDLFDCGFISSPDEAPSQGDIESCGKDVETFNYYLEDFALRKWRPYLTLENLQRGQNLFYLMKPSKQGTRWRLPTEEGLALAWQFGQVLELAHQKNIVYLDHKLEHIYWDGLQLQVIDLNSSRQLDGHSSDSQHFRMDIHNLCVGILYSVFTGLSPRKTTLRPQPGNFSDAEGRYKDITTLDFGVEPSLSPVLRTFLQRGAAMQIDTAAQFLRELQQVAAQHGWDFYDYFTAPPSRDARDHMRTGLRKLREGQDSIREARDLFREAAILDGITDDLEDELRRLVKATNNMLNNRVIP